MNGDWQCIIFSGEKKIKVDVSRILNEKFSKKNAYERVPEN